MLAFRANAQDTVSLNLVEINAKKINLSQIGKKIQVIDSSTMSQFKYSTISDLLNFNSTIFIKSYGPGAIATTALRGGNASQTAVLWNGFNLQNAMLGQNDLALIPSVLFENIEVEYGGSSSLWGSGAVGGSIHLNNKTVFNKGLLSSVNIGAGSFGSVNASSNILVSKQKFISSTKAYITSSQNNYLYRDTLDKENPIKKQKNSNHNLMGLMQELKFLINTRQILSVNAWVNSNQRRLPNYNQSLESKTYQNDDALRLTANWNYVKTNFSSNVKSAYFIDQINYTDSISSIFSKSKAKTIVLENENYFKWHNNHQLNYGINFTSNNAVTSNYSSSKTISKIAFLLGNKFSLFHDKLVSFISIRAERYSLGTLPITGNVAIDYKVFKTLTLSANAAKVYRQPTLNELYWLPGGNINLKPEQGYTYETSLNYSVTHKAFHFFASGAIFNRRINDWILWIPGANSNPSPINIQQVWSRGCETSWKLNFQKNKFRYSLGLTTSYVLSTTQATNQENSSTLQKQLIYTPRYTANGSAALGYAQFNMLFFHQYVGYRFTTSDNSEWINPYQNSSIRFNYNLELTKLNFIFYTACNNLFNQNYSVLAGRPMPLRNYEIGITLQTKYKK